MDGGLFVNVDKLKASDRKEGDGPKKSEHRVSVNTAAQLPLNSLYC